MQTSIFDVIEIVAFQSVRNFVFVFVACQMCVIYINHAVDYDGSVVSDL